MSLSANYPTVGPVLNMDFVNNQALDPRVTFTRASTATYYNYAGVLQTAPVDTPRFDYSPSTLIPQGLLIEESRTNSVRNNTMVGAVAGTPGTLPTNWSITGVPAGVTRTVVGTGTENGITYIDIQLSGTPSTGADIQIFPEPATGVAASPSQTWTESFYVRLASGATTNTSAWRLNLVEISSAPAFLRQTLTNISVPTSAGLATQRFSASATTGASTAYVEPSVLFSLTNGAAVDITLRIGLPQLEQGAFATSVIPTSTVAVTRSADIASMTGANFSSWYNAAAGTLFAQAQLVAGISATTPAAFLSVDDNTSNNRIQLRRQSPGTIGDMRFVSSGGNFTGTATSGTLLGSNKQIYAATASDQAAAVNGVLMTGITPVTPMPTVTQMQIGQGPNSAFLNGYIQRISYYNYRVTNAQLQALTGS